VTLSKVLGDVGISGTKRESSRERERERERGEGQSINRTRRHSDTLESMGSFVCFAHREGESKKSDSDELTVHLPPKRLQRQ
jgi:hypothetical protein